MFRQRLSPAAKKLPPVGKMSHTNRSISEVKIQINDRPQRKCQQRNKTAYILIEFRIAMVLTDLFTVLVKWTLIKQKGPLGTLVLTRKYFYFHTEKCNVNKNEYMSYKLDDYGDNSSTYP